MRSFILLITLFLSITIATIAQQNAIGVGVFISKKNSLNYSTEDLKPIKEKIESLLRTYQLNNSKSAFVLFPVITLQESYPVDNDFQKMHVTKVHVNFTIMHRKTEKKFGNFSKSLNGNANNELNSIINAFSRIRSNDPALKSFMSNIPSSINNFYDSNCQDLIYLANKETEKRQYQSALEILNEIPNNAPCYTKAQQSKEKYVKLLADKNCKEQVLKVQHAVSTKRYDELNDLIKKVDVMSPCYEEILNILKKQESIEKDKSQKQVLEIIIKTFS